MSDLLVVIPSRGRPAAGVEVARAFAETCTANTRLMLAVDNSDPERDQYLAACLAAPALPVTIQHCPSSTMVEALNFAAGTADASTIGFMGDDHRPRTRGWDQRYLEALREMGTGIVYGDDLLQGANLPTQCAMTSDIVRALGYMAPAGLTHLCVDDFWRDLGQAAGCLRYLPDVVVEHMHPVAGKAEWSEGHLRVNQPSMYQQDRTAYMRFRAEGRLDDAVRIVRALRGDA